MVNASHLARYLVYSILFVGEVCSSHLANEGEWKRSELEPRQLPQYIRIVQGLFRSQKIVRYLSDVPCDIIHTLENDAEQAKAFVDEIERGDVPTIIANLPNDAIKAILNLIRIFVTLPTEIVDVAEATITGAASVFNDIGSGAIVDDLKKVPGVIVSDITNAWGDFTSGLEDDWNAATKAIACAFSHCPVATDRTCRATQSTTAKAIQPTLSPLSTSKFPTQTGPISSTSPNPSIQSSQPSRSSASLPLSTIKSPTQTRSTTVSSQVSSQSSPQLFSSGTFDSSQTPALNAAAGLNIDRTIFRLKFLQLCWVLGLVLLGAIFLL